MDPNRKKSVFAFNHIDTKNQEKIDELKKLYEYYHKLWFCYKMVYSRSKSVLLALNLVSVSLVAIGSIAGGVTMIPVILGVISGAGVVLKTAMEMKNLSQKIEHAKFAFTSYANVLSELRNFLRREEFHKEDFLRKLRTLDDIVISMSLNWEKYVGKYKKNFWLKNHCHEMFFFLFCEIFIQIHFHLLHHLHIVQKLISFPED